MKDIVRRGYDAISRHYRADDDPPAGYAGWIADLHTRLPAGASVLDLGCGCGVPVSRELAARGHDVVGVDFSPVQIARARELVPAARFVEADAACVAFVAGSFDAAVCLYTLIHLPHDEQRTVIENLHSWLRPGGVLLATIGATACTGQQDDWLGGGAPIWWNHPDVDVSRGWFASAGFVLERDEFVPEGDGGHQLLVARRG